MTAASISGGRPPGGWTTEDLDALPEDGRRRELLDGTLITPPAPVRIHQSITGLLMAALWASCPAAYDVTQGMAVRFGQRLALVPDVLVIREAAMARHTAYYTPHEVVLTVEVVSPGTQSLDRITKPGRYARAGIPYHWRVEVENGAVAVYTHTVDPVHGLYVQTGRWTDRVKVDEPWPIALPVDRITPRFR